MKAQSNNTDKDTFWIVGRYDNEKIIGRMFKEDGVRWVCFVTESALLLQVFASDISEIKRLNIKVKSVSKNTTNCIITTSIEKKKRLSKIEKLIMQTLALLNT